MGRYDGTSKIIYKDHETLGRWKNYSWLIIKPADADIATFKVSTGIAGDARRIALAIYGDHNLFWVIVAFNSKWYQDAGAMNVFDWPVAGQILYYPVFSVISPTIN